MNDPTCPPLTSTASVAHVDSTRLPPPNPPATSHEPAETIVEIRDYEAQENGVEVAGFEVVTTKQRIKLYIDNEASCCERWGHFWCNDDPADFVGAQVRGVTITDTALHEAQMRANDLAPTRKEFEGGVMFVNLETDRGTLQFVAYNEHNGFYGHEAKVQCEQLSHCETL